MSSRNCVRMHLKFIPKMNTESILGKGGELCLIRIEGHSSWECADSHSAQSLSLLRGFQGKKRLPVQLEP